MKFTYTGTREDTPFRPGIEYGEAEVIVMYVDAVIEEGKLEAAYYRQKGTLGLEKSIAQTEARGAPNDRVFKTNVDAAVASDEFDLQTLRASLAAARAKAKALRVVINAMYGTVYESEEVNDDN